MAETAMKKTSELTGVRKGLDSLSAATLCRLAIGIMFTLSGIGKMMDINNSIRAVHDFQLPILKDLVWAQKFIGTVLPYAELIMAILILFDVFTRLSAAGIGFLSVVFFIGKFHVPFIQGRSVNCGCFGELMNTMAEVTIYLDIPFLIISIILIMSSKRYVPGIGQLLPDSLKQKLSKMW